MANTEKSTDPSTTLRTNSVLGTRVAVGMSGGVDSSVTALLLKEQGYDVVGFFMKLWHDPCGTGENACCDERAQADARAVAAKIGISFYVVDARAPFKSAVTDYFVEEYKDLKTPNPCLVCNKKIKFGWLLDFAKKNDCDYLATGHYARVIKKQNNHFALLKAADTKKDQSYFLSGLNQEQLSAVIFPLAAIAKEQVRKIAESKELPVYQKKESQEVCFVEDDYRDFLKSNLAPASFAAGEIVDRRGKIIGQHKGLINYTIGQRKGIDQNVVADKNRQPLYVIDFDKDNNQLIVGKEEDLYRTQMTVDHLDLIDSDIDITKEDDLSVKIRYRAQEVGCRVLAENGRFKIIFEKPQRAVTPGQFAVFYRGDEVIGNATIER